MADFVMRKVPLNYAVSVVIIYRSFMELTILKLSYFYVIF